jgi:hypothetical protein
MITNKELHTVVEVFNKLFMLSESIDPEMKEETKCIAYCIRKLDKLIISNTKRK